MLLTRQKILLYYLWLSGGTLSHLRLLKSCFLSKNESLNIQKTSFYDFLPYHYGPFSFQLYHDVNLMINSGEVLNKDKIHWQLTSQGIISAKLIPSKVKDDLARFHFKYKGISDNELINLAYQQYPWYAINSKLLNQPIIEKPIADKQVYTMGYEGSSIDAFLNKLMLSGIERLIDVRNNPISRRYGFHKSTLSNLCKKLDIEYYHFPELGIPSSFRQNLDNWDDYQILFNKYEKEVLPKTKDSINQIAFLMKEKTSTLLCMESNPEYCHRLRLARVLSQQMKLSIINL